MPYKAPTAAKPTKTIFDPFNSSATGHQRADNTLSGSTSWRDSRHKKLREQFLAGAGGGKRVNDTVGAGSLDFGKDGRTENGGWEAGAAGLRNGGQQSIWESMKVSKDEGDNNRPTKRLKTEKVEPESQPTSVVNPFTPFRKPDGKIRETSWPSSYVECSPSDLLSPIDPLGTPEQAEAEDIKAESADEEVEGHTETSRPMPPQIFNSLCFYVNGCTAPVSDHKLKHMISTHGGNMSIALGRRTVTHVILGKPNANGSGCGGGLAGSKIHKEITQMRGKSVKFITADWVTESIKAGKRLPESRFEAMKLAPKGVANISTMFKPKEKS
ncbi:hypothetical protein AC578_7779 [Pseudocercospora eumusae]|uniref:BRCT domain-containing protein n=1 Tax=Pseudocercospora eumusae TaxID=321146 RepID=A0A139H127_9PEZI|nr:hypothetical protein AC578_7779 [Pseudocercospora eumusae]